MTVGALILSCQYILVIVSTSYFDRCLTLSASGMKNLNGTWLNNTNYDVEGKTNTSLASDEDFIRDSLETVNISHKKDLQPPVIHNHHQGSTPPQKELPIAIIIAGPAAAVGIVLFVCVAYYCHTVQLDNRAKQLAVTMFVTQSPNSLRTQRFVPLHRNENDNGNANSSRRKSTLVVPNLNLPLPPNSNVKRGSSWSAIADQELLNLAAPRRHSTFIL